MIVNEKIIEIMLLSNVAAISENDNLFSELAEEIDAGRIYIDNLNMRLSYNDDSIAFIFNRMLNIIFKNYNIEKLESYMSNFSIIVEHYVSLFENHKFRKFENFQVELENFLLENDII